MISEHMPGQLVFLSDEYFSVLVLWNLESAILPLQCSCLENPMDRERSLVGYSPWGHKESHMTE